MITGHFKFRTVHTYILYCSYRALSVTRSHNIQPNKMHSMFSDMLYYNILLIKATCFDPSWDHHQGFVSK
jgi:hypothetical protein